MRALCFPEWLVKAAVSHGFLWLSSDVLRSLMSFLDQKKPQRQFQRKILNCCFFSPVVISQAFMCVGYREIENCCFSKMRDVLAFMDMLLSKEHKYCLEGAYFLKGWMQKRLQDWCALLLNSSYNAVTLL